MVDVLTPEQRSKNMSRIRGSDTGPEVRLRRALWQEGLRYRLKSKLPGKPDLVFPSSRVTVFVDGCFWHGCPEHAVKPETNTGFWVEKIDKNKARDVEVTEQLESAGWTVIRVWEHEVNGTVEASVERIRGVVRRTECKKRKRQNRDRGK